MNVETLLSRRCGAFVSGLRATVVFFIAVLLWTGCGPSLRTSCQATCTGCCDVNDRCQVGTLREACGIAGNACSTCQSDQTCTVGVCSGRGTPGPAPTAGGAAGGGAAGGAAGGVRAGGSGGSGGGATPTGSRCAGTTVECNGSCVELATDESHCGRCGSQCGAGLVCSAGRCEALPTDCLAKQCPADFGCDPETRACTRRCFSNADCRASGSTCQSGTCRCSGGGTTCGGACWFGPTCSYPSGSEGHAQLGCIDIDECARGTRQCGANEVCRNESPGSTCDCARGFRRVGSQCVVDACATNNGGCHPRATCDQFTASQVSCECPFDMVGDGRTCSPTCTSQGSCSDPSLACFPTPSSFNGVCERPGVGVAGDICGTNADCSRGTRCERRTGSSIGFCARLCGSATCGASETCVTSSGAQVCLKLNGQPCDLLKQDCSGGCYATTSGAVCAPAGWSSSGSSCSAANSCVTGATCLAPGGSMNFTCTALCDPNAPACSSGTCQPLGGFPGVGVCG